MPGADGRTRNSNGGGWNPEAEAEQGFYNRMETIDVSLIPEREGWFLQKYRVESNKRGDVLTRRYSDFVWLYATLLKRYVSHAAPASADTQPFRLLPALPPKRINRKCSCDTTEHRLTDSSRCCLPGAAKKGFATVPERCCQPPCDS